ncbi:MAG: hypothetical protein B7X04_01770 [Parcubacteria group bacterium 21-54-25]|nr:MAG: hypothetical protein B7X04_01770 [Parcubacteria group bacterium 21-54-25]HQU07696.1 type 4a pilus biogenesis protein PilO [Candidatus Paceibacterota bacterium]
MNNRLVILIELLFVVGLYFVYIQPTYSDTIVPLNAQITATEAAQIAAKQYTSKESQLQNQFNQISTANRTRLDQFLPATAHSVHFLYDLNTLAANAGFTLSKFSANTQTPATAQNGRAATAPSVQSFTVDLSGTGSYQSFRTFLTGLEHSLRLIDVQSIKVTAGTASGSSANKNAAQNATYSMTLKVYWLGDSSHV